MRYDESLTNWIVRLADGDEHAIQIVFDRYFQRLISLAVKKMHGLNDVSLSGEDIALSAFKSFCYGVRNNKLVLSTENELWGCLFKITLRKVCAERRRTYADKRGGNILLVRDDKLSDESDETLFDTVAGKEPSPELALELAENADELLSLFDKTSIRAQIISMKLKGYSIESISKVTGLGQRTVSWHISKIQSKWMFYKTLEYLVDSIFDYVSFAMLGNNLDWPQEAVVAVVKEMYLLWTKENNELDWTPLQVRIFDPEQYSDLYKRGDSGVRQVEAKIGYIQGHWLQCIRSSWGKKLEKLVKEMLPCSDKA